MEEPPGGAGAAGGSVGAAARRCHRGLAQRAGLGRDLPGLYFGFGGSRIAAHLFLLTWI